LKVLVTGATGFVGQHLCRRLAELGHRVFAADCIAGPARTFPGCEYRACDVCEFTALRAALRWARPDWIFHLAAISSPPEAARHPDETWRTNFLGTVHLYEAVRLSKRKPRILFVGSSDEYGAPPQERLPIDETCPLSPTGVYGSSKAAADLASAFFVERHGLDIVRVRPFNHTGPGQSPRFVCSDFARQVAEAARRPLRKRTMLVGNLDARRDFTDVRDIVRAYVLALERCPKGEVYNIASGKAVRVGDILEKLIALADAKIEVRLDPKRLRPSDAPRIVGDASKFRRATGVFAHRPTGTAGRNAGLAGLPVRKNSGWRPGIPLDDTLRDLLEYWRAQLKAENTHQ